MDFSIVVPTWNRSELVEALLKSLYDERSRYKSGKTEVLIVDSSTGSEKDRIVSACEKYDAKYIEGADSVRKKRNKGIDSAQFEYVLFIDSDVTVKEGLLQAHANTLKEGENNPQITGSFGLTEFVGERKFWFKVVEYTSFLNSFSFAKLMPFVSWCIGNNVALRKDELIKIGKFEENFPFKLGGDDLEMTYRYTSAGNLIKTSPEAVTYHSRETWNNHKAIHDRAKRWGTMEYYILKRFPELVHRRLPTTEDVVALVTLVFGAVALFCWSLTPLLFLASWDILLFIMLYVHRVREHGRTNLFYWTIASIEQSKYRFYRLLVSLKERDLSLAFQGQFFGICHIKADYQSNVKKTWIYYYAIIALIIVMMIYRCVMGS